MRMISNVSNDFGIFQCGKCGRLLKLDDLPCTCGNEDDLKNFFEERRDVAFLGLGQPTAIKSVAIRV